MSSKRILSIGQCGVDHDGIGSFLRSHIKGLVFDPAASEAEALAALNARSYHLILVNRVLDRDHSSGIDIIRRLKADSRFAPVPVMLVSNFAEAQSQAQSAGALPGFGKSGLDDAALAKVKVALGEA